MQARHREGVDVAAVAERIAAVAPFRLEAELAVERDRGGVVDVDGELDAQHAHPAIGVVAERLHQRRADALALRGGDDRQADHDDVAPPQRRAGGVHAGRADDLAVALGDEQEIGLAGQKAVGDSRALDFLARVRHLHQVGVDHRLVHQAGDRRGVVGTRSPDRDLLLAHAPGGLHRTR